jgi:hypothetical protein
MYTDAIDDLPRYDLKGSNPKPFRYLVISSNAGTVKPVVTSRTESSILTYRRRNTAKIYTYFDLACILLYADLK